MASKIPLAVADVELQLATAISVGSTSFSLSDVADDDGNSLPPAKYCFTIDNGLSTKEYLIGDLSSTTVSNVKTVTRQGSESSGAARAHRVGASVIITDFATIQRVADILRGQETLDADNPLYYDAEPTLGDREQLATVGYVLDNVSGGSVTFDSQVITGNAGETVSAGDVVYFKTSDQEWYKADADTTATIDGVQLGIAKGSGTDGNAITGGIQISGSYTTTGLTAGSTYYVSNTAGAYATSAGTNSRIIGVALSTTRLLLAPTNVATPTSGQLAALAGTPSTPSSTNKFVTQAKSVTAGATISGATTPVPVYQNTTDNEFYACDANDTAAMKFLGFAISNGTDGAAMLVQFSGVVSGFTALDEGKPYYLSDTAGAISATPGSAEVLVGVAISTTELVITRGRRWASGTATFSSTTTTAVTTGFRPSRIIVNAMVDGGGVGTARSFGTWSIAGGQRCIYDSVNNSAAMDTGNVSTTETWVVNTNSDSSRYHSGTITSVTDTGFTLSNTKNSTPSNMILFWEAEGDL